MASRSFGLFFLSLSFRSFSASSPLCLRSTSLILLIEVSRLATSGAYDFKSAVFFVSRINLSRWNQNKICGISFFASLNRASGSKVIFYTRLVNSGLWNDIQAKNGQVGDPCKAQNTYREEALMFWILFSMKLSISGTSFFGWSRWEWCINER